MKKLFVLLVIVAFVFAYCGKANKTANVSFSKFSLGNFMVDPEKKKAAAEAVKKLELKNKKGMKALYTQQINNAKYINNIMFYLGCNALYGICDIDNNNLQYFKDDMEDMKLALQRLGGFDDQITAINNFTTEFQGGTKTGEQLLDEYKANLDNLDTALYAKEKDYYTLYLIGMDTVNLMVDANAKDSASMTKYEVPKHMQEAIDFLNAAGQQNTDAYADYTKINSILAKGSLSDQDFDDLFNLGASAAKDFVNVYNQ